MNTIDKLKTLKDIKPDKEWSLLVMAEILKNEQSKTFPQLTLLQKVKIFVNMRNNTFKTFAIPATTAVATAVLIIGVGIFMQTTPNNLLLDSNTQAEINSILAEIEKINLAIRVEVDNDRISEQNVELMTLLDQRYENRLRLQSIISKEVSDIKIRREKELTNRDIEILLLAQKANDVENFHLALFILKNIRN